MTYETFDVERPGGALRVGRWGSGPAPELRSSVAEEAVLTDSESDLREGAVEQALSRLRQPAVLLRAPMGLADADPLYSDETVARWRQELPALVTRSVPDVNHFTITLSEQGAAAVAAALLEITRR